VTLVVFPSKDTGETIPLVFNFSDKLQFGETISGSSLSVSVFSGTDPSPNSILSGSPVNAATQVTQSITGGVAGVIYTIVCLVTATGSHNYAKTGHLAVITTGGRYTNP
jgi:hypothetical protein